MKLTFLFIVLILGAKAHSQSTDVITAHIKALNAHDLKAITAGYTSGAEIESPNWEGLKKGTAEIAEVYRRYFSSTPNIAYQVTRVINAGNDVIVEYTAAGTFANPEAGTPAFMKDKKYTLKYCALFTLSNGKISKETDYFDQVAFLRQVGFFDQH